MIVLLDIEKQSLYLYGKKGMKEVAFSHAGEIYDYLESENILYITNAIEVNAADLIDMIKGMGVVIQDDIKETGIKYLHAAGEGGLYIDESLQFKGKYDCKIIDENMRLLMESSPVLQNLIRNKKIEVIGERKKVSLSRQKNKDKQRQTEQQETEDEKLDSIILDKKVSEWEGSRGKSEKTDGAIIIDLNKGGRVGLGDGGGIAPSFNTMSELMDSIEGLK